MPIAAPMPPRSVVRAVRCADDGTGPSDTRVALAGVRTRTMRADSAPGRSSRFDTRVRRTRRQAVGDDRAATLSPVSWAKLRPLRSRDPALHS